MASSKSAFPLDVPVAILAGGLATRLQPLTTMIPKSLLEVSGEPFIAHQLRLLRMKGIRKAVLCVGHLGEQIEAFVGDGKPFGLDVLYSYDGPHLLGTGGAVRKALPLLGESFLVMYGDSYLDMDMAALVSAFGCSGKKGMMTVLRNENRWDRSNVLFEAGVVRHYDKKSPREAMKHIDYGLTVLKAEAFASFGPSFDLAELFSALIAEGQMGGFEAAERFYEIGSPSGLRETEHYLSALKSKGGNHER
ncbi:MAG: nucleotidyltransferase family protein [Candidatus Eremiobacteraeota bacterium]|nr:nucleotidyltransferase family protein [Candidatus Eremiobacteraeota bacterium]